jgi:hypothetical protein
MAVSRESDGFWRLPDGRLAPVLHHLRRATFSHRLTAGELARGVVDLCPDLLALALPRIVARADGTELRAIGAGDDDRAAEGGSLAGPAGWLATFAPGDLLAVRYDGEAVSIDPVEPSALDAAAGRDVAGALRATYEALPATLAPEVHRLVVDTMGLQPASFSVPVEPLTDLLAGAGLRVRDAWVGPDDRPWPTPPEQARRRRLDELATGADWCCQGAARRALDAWHEWLQATAVGNATAVGSAAATGPAPNAAAAGPTGTAASTGTEPAPSPPDVDRLLADIDHGAVAALLAEVATMGRPLVGTRRLGEWAGAVAAGARSRAAGVAYLRALGADASGDPVAAEALLGEGLASTADHAACLGFLAELAADRGDAERSLSLLRQTGRPPGAEQLRDLEPFLLGRPPGRNDPCPCGSGRKYKACCAGRPLRRPLLPRARWLLRRATRHALRTDPANVQALRNLFETSGGDPASLATDMLLFPGRGLARYLDNRGALLADDERAAARAWLSQPMRLLEAGPATGGAVEARDIAAGEVLVLEEPSLADGLSEGDLVLARPLPVGEVWLLSGAVVPVPWASRPRVLELLEQEVRPVHLVQLLVELQVDAIRASAGAERPPTGR